MKKIGVVGAGTMGIGISQCLAQVGLEVILVDISDEILNRSKREIIKNIRYSALFNKGEQIESVDTVIERITFTTDYHLLSDIDFLVENVTEKYEIKKSVYELIDPICPKNCVFAINTSCISITKLASSTKRQDRVIGMHFMNPVQMKPVIEAIRGFHTSDETINVAKKFLATMGKQMILVNDLPGFVSNRLSHLLMNEAAFVIQDQVAQPQDVDNIFKECFNHAMGPLETADLIGLDTIVDSLDVLYESYQDSKYRVCPLLRKMVDAGHCGRKSGRGFYDY
ncbi:3-hydroxybutyryl-CoA dehydrogenase [Paenibacillus sp. CF095]|uniref:3-hydroxyacyl-CoA dehydrogenase family protein n=1 Tax=Paenibacillus sp. CF095 TaxID=1881033 RepID=UPI0008920B45|nr:3-hydroxyacyl-CoA dehydrogenase family protein [Paenibacillus sp. CF095]SDD50997.1 3-hydroxybutyryl-CoA dehydrogenase [Paenibacillus sp. CF095]